MNLDTIEHMSAIDYLRTLPDDSVHCCVTSPPYYGLRQYLDDDNPDKVNEIGLEDTPAAFVARLVEVFEEVRRVLRGDGTCWVNLGDSYVGGGGYAPDAPSNQAGSISSRTGKHGVKPSGAIRNTPGLKAKDMIGIPWRVAFALQDAGWWLRSDIIWKKPNPMPESVTDRPTKAHEYVFLLAKSGTAQFWTHRDHAGTRVKPEPDYRWIDNLTQQETATEPHNWRAELIPDTDKKRWKRINLWRGRDYWYDADAIREPVAPSTIGRGPVDFGGAKGRDYKPGKDDPNYRGGNEQWGRTFDYKTSCANGRNKRTVWTVATEPSSLKHFAMFPQALIEPMILAGCPSTVCSECGAGYVRDIERKANYTQRQDRGQPNGKPPQVDSSGWEPATVTDRGFAPSCTCNATTDTGIVIDPFMGTGTTAIVAQKHGRHWLGCDVNAETVELANSRTRYHGDDKRMMVENAAGIKQMGLFGD